MSPGSGPSIAKVVRHFAPKWALRARIRIPQIGERHLHRLPREHRLHRSSESETGAPNLERCAERPYLRTSGSPGTPRSMSWRRPKEP